MNESSKVTKADYLPEMRRSGKEAATRAAFLREMIGFAGEREIWEVTETVRLRD